MVDTDGNTCLHYAARGGCSKKAIEAILNHGADVNASNKSSQTTLMWACEKRKIVAINVLLNAGADPNIADTDGNTCLHDAVRRGFSKEAINAILNHGADVNASNKRSQTTLMLASKERNIYAIPVLLSAGADPSILDEDGNTCLHYAATEDCRRKVLHAIVNNGADVNSTNKSKVILLMAAGRSRIVATFYMPLNSEADKNGATWMDYAISKDCKIEILHVVNAHIDNTNATDRQNFIDILFARTDVNGYTIVGLLKTGTDPNIADAEGDTYLHNAVLRFCSMEVLRAIIYLGAGVNNRNKHNRTALVLASMIKNEDAITVLLDAGADLTIADVEGDTCLHGAILGGCSSNAIRAMIIHGADVNAMNKCNQTALILASLMGHLDAIDVCLNARADPNSASTNGNTCLHYAVLEGCSIECLQTLIAHGADVNAANKYNVTALMKACEKGNIDAINVLLNAGADTNIAGADGDTCLHNAVSGGCSKEVLETIITHGADVNITNRSSGTALMMACQKGNTAAMSVFLSSGANPNIPDEKGNTLLHIAMENNISADTVQIVIDHGANVNATNKQNETPLVLASHNENVDAVNMLLKVGADTNISFNDTCLHHVLRRRCSKEMLQAIINHGAEINATDTNGRTALMIACAKGNSDAINTLLEAGADPKITDADGETCLYYAVDGCCSKEVLQIIINHGADVNATNTNNVTALMTAYKKSNADAICVFLNAGASRDVVVADRNICFHDAVSRAFSKEVLQAMISHGSDVNSTNTNNVTPLMMACQKGNIDVISVLLTAGSNPNLANDDGDTWLHCCVEVGCSKEVLEAIINHGVDVNAANNINVTALMIACQKADIDAIGVLLNAGSNPNIGKDNGDTCLHYAVEGGCGKEVLKALITHGANINATRKNKVTTLMIVCKNQNVEAADLLLNAGANPAIADADGNTCLHYAVSEDCSKEILETITNHGADVNATNNKNHTALMMACGKRNVDAFNVLLNAGADTSVVSLYGNTWLHLAVLGSCNKGILQGIVNYGVDVNAVNNEGSTALMLACETGQMASVTVLLEAGTDTAIFDVHGDTCLHKLFHRECNQNILWLLLHHGVPVNATNKSHQTAYTLACNDGNINAMRALINAGGGPMNESGDDDTSICCFGCCNILTLQTIIQWLNPTSRQDCVPLEPLSPESLESNILEESIPLNRFLI